METFKTGSVTNFNIEDFKGYNENLEIKEQARARSSMKYLPAMFVDYIVRNDRSWKEVLTANYTMANPALAAAIDAAPLLSFENNDYLKNRWEWKPCVQQSPASLRLPDVAMDHAGILSTYPWLNKYPSTATNRNRHRANLLLYQFMAYDIEKTGARPTNFSNQHYDVPTIQESQCLACHTTLEPIAGSFQDWGLNGAFWDKAPANSIEGHSLDKFYTAKNLVSYPTVSSQAPFNAQETVPYYRTGDRWYRDMLEPGYNSAYTGVSQNFKMPGSYKVLKLILLINLERITGMQ